MGIVAYVYDFIVMILFAAVGLFAGFIIGYLVRARMKMLDKKFNYINSKLEFIIDSMKPKKRK